MRKKNSFASRNSKKKKFLSFFQRLEKKLHETDSARNFSIFLCSEKIDSDFISNFKFRISFRELFWDINIDILSPESSQIKMNKNLRQNKIWI